MSKDFEDLVINLSLGCGFAQRMEESEPLSDYWTEDAWNELSEEEKESWLHEFWLEWKCNYEDGGATVE